jgi:glycosyltransferase involved in cell wall biosynthesis
MTPSLVGLHPLWMDTDPNGGIATYWSCLIAELGRLSSPHRYRVYFPDEAARRSAAYLPPSFEPRTLRPSSRWVSLPLSLPWELARHPVHLLHVQSLAPPFSRVPVIQTINDLAWILHPEVFPPLLRLRMEFLCRRSSARATRILTVSEFSKKQIVDHYNVPDEKVTVTHHGVHEIYRVIDDPAPVAAARRRYGLDGPFILYVGKLQARKNLARLVRAFHILRQDFHLPHRLVLVGKRTYLSQDIFDAIAELGLQPHVSVLGEAPLADMPLLHAASDLFVFPSLSEGFGLPPLEAMACGSPVVSSNSTSLPEVVGDAGLLVDPLDVPALARAMRDVLTNPELRARLRERGLQRAALFSNRRMAELTLRAYDETLSTLPTPPKR